MQLHNQMLNMFIEQMNKEFYKKTIIIVGGSRGIGKGVSDKFKELGAEVKIISTNNCNIRQKKSIDDYFSKIEKFDILVNCAGINYCKKINDISYEEWNEVLETNLTSYFYIIKKSIPPNVIWK